MSRSLIVALALAPLAITACASSEAAPPPASTPAPAAASSSGDYQSLCVESMTKNRTCTAEYIPALVDSRAKIDKPPGIAESVKADRDGVIAKAMEEWAEDSKDENIARNCQMLTEHMDDSAKPAADGIRGCLAQQDCNAYVACAMPVFEDLMARAHPHP
jgi:hypothetical protein